jgi:hypothetical protein
MREEKFERELISDGCAKRQLSAQGTRELAGWSG